MTPMTTDLSRTDGADMDQLLPQELGEPQVQDNIAYSIQRLVIQCGALLRHQLERKARNGSQPHSEADVDRVMFEYQATSPQIEATIADEVTAFALDRIGRVFANALGDGVEALDHSAKEDGSAARPLSPPAHARPTSAPVAEPAPAPKPAEQPTPNPRVTPAAGSKLNLPGPGGLVTDQKKPSAEQPGSQHENADPPAKPDRGGGGVVPARYQGTVNLTIESTGDAGGVVSFINSLRQMRGVLLSQLMGGTSSASSIQLRLPGPIPLADLLLSMKEVSSVVAQGPARGEGDIPRLTVQLGSAGVRG